MVRVAAVGVFDTEVVYHETKKVMSRAACVHIPGVCVHGVYQLWPSGLPFGCMIIYQLLAGHTCHDLFQLGHIHCERGQEDGIDLRLIVGWS
jgi:hypothetical protein